MNSKFFIKLAVSLLAIILLGFVAIQFIPVNRTNPPTVREPNWDSAQTRALAKRACFDCHSNETQWPWYANIAPVSWMVADHVIEGRAALNLSEWDGTLGETNRERGEAEERNEWEEEGEAEEGEEAENASEEMVEQIQSGEMPLWEYLMLHPEARLTPAETKALINGLEATFGLAAGGAVSQALPSHN